MKTRSEQIAYDVVQAILQAQDKLKDLERPPIGIVVKPCLFEVVRKLAGTSSRVFTHLQQKEEILFFYDRALLRQHLDSRLDHCICRHHLSDHVWGSNKERDGCKLCDCTAYIEPDWLEEAQAV